MLMGTMAVAEENQLGYLPILKKWNGPFEGTEIVKYVDYSDGVACYVYTPTSVNYSTIYSGGTSARQFNGNIGSISCVKVVDNQKKK